MVDSPATINTPMSATRSPVIKEIKWLALAGERQLASSLV